jgi:hypothetical protein
MRSRSYHFALMAISCKFVMDFFLPAREISFLIFNGVVALLLVILSPRLHPGRRVVTVTGALTAVVILQLLRDPTNTISYKLLSLPALSVLFYSIGCNMTNASMMRLLTILIVEFSILFAGNYGLSSALGLIKRREFWNFEHPNLLGSYLLIMLIPINYMLLRIGRGKRTVLQLIFVAAAYITTSTGTLLLSLGVYLRARNATVPHMIGIVMFATGLFAIGMMILSIFNVLIYEKIMAPFVLISKGGWDQLVQTAQSGGGMAYLSAEQQGSFTWRIYAYLVYGFYLVKQDSFATLFGNGVGGYADIWSGAMPHNDFILILVDFGLIVFAGVAWMVVRTIRRVARFAPAWLCIVMILTIRLIWENNIYSYYLMSHAIIFASLIVGVEMRNVRERSIGVQKMTGH